MRLSRWTAGVLAGLVSVTGCSAPVPAARPGASRPASAIIAHQGPPATAAPTRTAPSTTPTPEVTPPPAITPQAGALPYIANVRGGMGPGGGPGEGPFEPRPRPGEPGP